MTYEVNDKYGAQLKKQFKNDPMAIILKNQLVFINKVNMPRNPKMQIIQNHLSPMGFLIKKFMGGSNEINTKNIIDNMV